MRGAGLLAALGLLVLVANMARGAQSYGLSAHDDEAGHVITGLMVRDWLASGFPEPVAFAQEYYLRYPKVAIGHWPPLFYLIQGLWTWLFGAGQWALVALMSLFAGTAAWLLARAAEPRVGLAAALLAAVLFLALPLVQWYGAGVMLEVPLALGCLASALALGMWLDAPSLQRALAFGGLAAATALLKGNGLCLALVPPLALLASGRWSLLRARSWLWMPVPVLLLGAPWYVLTLNISRSTWDGGRSPSLEYSLGAVPFYLRHLALLGGPAAAALAVLGVSLTLLRRRGDGVAIALAALMAAVLLFHVLLPSSLDARHLVLLAAPFAFFAVSGAQALARAVGAAGTRRRALAVGGLALVLLLPSAILVRREYGGYREVLARLLADPELEGVALLVSSDPIGDGLAITAAALGEPRGERVVLRATKSLARSNWMGDHYRERFASDEELEEWLRAVPVGVVLLDHSQRPAQQRQHHDRLADAVARDPERWRPLGAFDVQREGRTFPGALVLYRREGPLRPPAEPLDARLLLGQPMRGPGAPGL